MVQVKVSIWNFIKSFGKVKQLSEIIACGVQVNYEQGLDGGPSNVHVLLHHLERPVDTNPIEALKMHVGKVLVQDAHAMLIRPGGIRFAQIDLGTIREDFTGKSTAQALEGIFRIIFRSFCATVGG